MPTNGKIAGVVLEGATPVVAGTTYLYDRQTGALVASQVTDANGVFSYAGLDETLTDGYFIVALDPDGGTQYNALVYDRLTAVTSLTRTLSAGVGETSLYGTVGAAMVDYAYQVLADTPVAYWKLSDTSGAVLDSGPNALHGSIHGTVSRGAAGLRPGSAAFSFGGNGCVRIPHNALMQIGADATWSTELWMYGTGGYTWTAALARVTDNDLGSCEYITRFMATQANKVCADWDGPSSNYGFISTPSDLNTTYHVVFVREPTIERLYVNGAQVATKAVTSASTLLATCETVIGGNPQYPSSYGFFGRISDVALYDYALSAAQVATHYTLGTH